MAFPFSSGLTMIDYLILGLGNYLQDRVRPVGRKEVSASG
jgi:hypothetical protein